MPPELLWAYEFLESQNTVLVEARIDFTHRQGLLLDRLNKRHPKVATYRDAQLEQLRLRRSLDDLTIKPMAPLAWPEFSVEKTLLIAAPV